VPPFATYDLGDPVTLSHTFSADPTTVTLEVRRPSGVWSTVAPTKNAPGDYSHAFTPDVAGVWRWKWTGEGPGADVETGALVVRGDVVESVVVPPTTDLLLDHEAATTGAHGLPDPASLVVTTDARMSDQRVPLDGSVTGPKIDPAGLPQANIAGLVADLAAKVDDAEKGVAGGVATLDAGGLLSRSQLPPIAIGETFTVATEAAMLALAAQRGDVAIRTDLNPDGFFLLVTDDPTLAGNWKQILAPGAVLSVQGLTGAVTLPEDGTAATPSLRTLGTGAQQAARGNIAAADLPAPATTGGLAAGTVASQLAAIGNRAVPHARGAVVMSWDDGHANWGPTLRERLRTRGQHNTFFVTSDYIDKDSSKVTTADLVALAGDGNEIGSHAQTHTNLTTLTPAQRAAEFAASIAKIESIIGAGKCTSFAYPFGRRVGGNATIDNELYLRFQRVADAGQDATRSLVPWDERHPFLTPRAASWTSATHADVLDMVRTAARLPVLACIFSHTPGIDQTEAEIAEAMDLIQSLGLPTLTYQEAFPGEPVLLRNPGFEAGIRGWRKIESGAGQTMEAVADTPFEGFSGTTSLRLATTSDTSFVYAFQSVPLRPNTTYRLTGRARATLGTGTGYVALRVQPNTVLEGVNAGGAFTGNQITATAGWTAMAVEFTTPQDARGGRVDCLLLNRTGEAWFDHLHLAPKADGSYG
jgi:peptidoglycan/xylan/chitin deacetylase (PgdA/CDA1 family)